MDAVVNGVLFKNWDEIISDPAKVLWTVTDKQSVYQIFFTVVIYQLKMRQEEISLAAAETHIKKNV